MIYQLSKDKLLYDVVDLTLSFFAVDDNKDFNSRKKKGV